MRYLLLVRVHADAEGAPPPGAIGTWLEDVDRSGQRVVGARLRPTAETTVVRRRGGELLVTDGPFADAKEWIGGFDVLEVGSREEAIEIASRHPMVELGTIELSAFWPFTPEELATGAEIETVSS